MTPRKRQSGDAKPDKMSRTMKQARALELRIAGYSYEEIRQELGYANVSTPFRIIDTALKARVREAADELIELEVSRLDAMLKGVWTKATKGNVAAIVAAIRISERRARFSGTDKPFEIDLGALVRDVAGELGLDEDEAAGILTDLERTSGAKRS